MKIDFSQELQDLDGVSLKVMKGEQEVPFILAKVCVDALMATYQDELALSGEEKLKRFDLATIIYASREPVDLQAENIALIKKLVAKGYGPLIVGQTWKMLDPQ
jgi:hypothetical protein